MRVLLVNKFWYRRGGAEQVVFATKELLEKAGHVVAVFGMDDPRNEITSPYFSDFVNTEKPRIFDLWKILYNRQAKKKFIELIKEFKPDIIHFHNIYHQLSFSLIDAGREMGIPMVMTLHDYHWLSPNYNLFHHGHTNDTLIGKRFFRPLFANCFENWKKTFVGVIDFSFRSQKKYRNAITRFICPSEFIKTLHTRAGFDEKKIIVIQNPVDHFIGEDNFIDGSYVAYAGRLSKEKGIETFIRAAGMTPHISYKIFGAGPDETRLRMLAENSGISNVSFEGFKTGAELEFAIKNARLLVLPSLWYENAPMSIVEPMAMGKVVIGSRIGGIPEMLPEELLFSPGDSSVLAEIIIRWFNASTTDRLNMGQELQKRTRENYDPKIYIQKIVELYKILLR